MSIWKADKDQSFEQDSILEDEDLVQSSSEVREKVSRLNISYPRGVDKEFTGGFPSSPPLLSPEATKKISDDPDGTMERLLVILEEFLPVEEEETNVESTEEEKR